MNSNPWGWIKSSGRREEKLFSRGKTLQSLFRFSISKFTEMSRSSEEETGGLFWLVTWPFTCLVWKPKQIFLLFFSYFNCSRIWRKNKYFHFIFSILIAQKFGKKTKGILQIYSLYSSCFVQIWKLKICWTEKSVNKAIKTAYAIAFWAHKITPNRRRLLFISIRQKKWRYFIAP